MPDWSPGSSPPRVLRYWCSNAAATTRLDPRLRCRTSATNYDGTGGRG